MGNILKLHMLNSKENKMENCPVCKNLSSNLDSHFRTNHPSEYRKLKEQHEESGNGGDFILSAAIGYATGSAILGTLLGGDIVGGVIGSMFGDDD